MPPAPDASASLDINAAPDTVYGLLTDIDALAELGEEVYRHRWIGKKHVAAPGAKFVGLNKNRFYRWGTVATITDTDPGARFAFDVNFGPVPVSRWQYDIEATESGCRVTESTWDRRPGWFNPIGLLTTGVKDRAPHNLHSIEGTLRNLKARAEAGA